ncbi:hypothetical protein EHQ61_13560 [Leptospira wolffii]|uniref:hypothetical protein n=1 Tax=Leptospira wolffii TaxID=409998 RepID=UPI00108271EF|nr:hypothetical protein [Leptospira wolffii]TGL49467.1 hypothetical protein EHQ61_13560 [Leptospira wolffii]
MKYLKFFPVCLFLMGFSVHAEEVFFGEQKTKMRLAVTSLSVNSAAAKNALKLENSLMLNNALGSTVDYYIPSISTFKGQTIDWDTGIRYSPFFRSNFLFSYSSAKAGSGSQSNIYDSSWSNSGTDYRDTELSTTVFSNNTLKTYRVGYSMDFFVFQKSESSFWKNLAIRAGVESFKTEVDLKSNYSNYGETYIPGGVPEVYGGLDPLRSRKIKNQDVFYNFVTGVNYSETFREKHRVDLGIEVFKSFSHEGLVEVQGLTTLGSPYGTSIYPYGYTAKTKSDLLGARLQLGYTYDISQSVSFGLYGMYSYANNTVKSTNLSLIPDFYALTSGNMMAFLASAAGASGPFPKSVDIRSQIGIQFLFRY